MNAKKAKKLRKIAREVTHVKSYYTDLKELYKNKDIKLK